MSLAVLLGVSSWMVVTSPPPNAASPPDQVRIVDQLHDDVQARAELEATRTTSGNDGLPFEFGRPSVHTSCGTRRDGRAPICKAGKAGSAVGWSSRLTSPRIEDRRTRAPEFVAPPRFVDTLETGTRFVYDVFVGGNPAGTAEAYVGEVRDAVPGEAPTGRPVRHLAGRATTGGVATVVGTLRDDMDAWIDAETGAALRNVNVIVRSGLLAPYDRRVTVADYAGRGHVRIVDQRDEKRRTTTRRVPENTLDAMGAMAWVRSLELAPGQQASAHGIDGHVLLRIDVIHRGHVPLHPMPSIGTALGIAPGDLVLFEGMLTRVDGHGVALSDEPVASFRAWMTDDARRIILALESDIWLTVLRLVLSRYDAPVSLARPR